MMGLPRRAHFSGAAGIQIGDSPDHRRDFHAYRAASRESRLDLSAPPVA
jgi:hypothetical protein